MRSGVLIVGPYPPPYGGLSVQVSVLRRLLADKARCDCRVLDIGERRRQRRPGCLASTNPLTFAGIVLAHAARQYVIHLHTNGHNLKSWLTALACALAGLLNGRKTALSVGSGLAPEWLQRAGPAARAIARVALALSGVVICRNERTRAALAGPWVPAEKIVVLPGFYGLDPAGAGPIPPAVEEFLRRHAPVVGALASIGPEYGLPLVASAAARLREGHPGLGLLLVGPAPFEHPELNGGLMVTGALPHDVTMAVMRRMAVFVRPTYFDGDSSSVREALALGVPVVASDTDFRPEGVVLFRRGNADDLADKLVDVLGDGGSLRRGKDEDRGSWPQLLAIYERLSGRPWPGGAARP